MREAVRRVTLKPATDYVLVASHEILDAPFDEVLAAVVDALEAIRMKTEGSRS
jgi:RNase P protein component